MKFIALIILTSLLLLLTPSVNVVQAKSDVSQAVDGKGQVNLTSTTVIKNSNTSKCETDPDFKFPSCKSILSKPGDIAHYSSGLHQIVGGPLLPGSDDVYSLKENNFVQCFCPVEGTDGIQTNWLRTDNPIDGWFFENGTQWNLGNFSYAAQNIDFKCPSKVQQKSRKK